MNIKTLIKGAFLASYLALGAALFGQTTPTTTDKILAQIPAITNYAVEPYFTLAPKAPQKYGGGVLMVYNVDQFVGLGLGLDWLGQLSMVSGNVQLQAPFHPLKQFPSFVASPFVLGGVATAYSGAGHFNGQASTISDVGFYTKFGHVAGGQFNTGVAWGRWNGVGKYDVARYHLFVGYSHGF